MPDRRFRMTVAYDGTDFAGFQRQSSERTVQGVLEKVLSLALRENIRVVGAGRTDAGVHALGQVVHFDSSWGGPAERLKLAVSSGLPSDIAVTAAGLAGEGFHARYGARFRRYGYLFLLSDRPDPMRERYGLRVRPGLDVRSMAAASEILRGRHDFRQFMSGIGPDEDPDPVRTVQRVRWGAWGPWRLFVVQADGFLRHMVRNVVAALLQIGIGRLDLAEFREMVHGGSGGRALRPAPPSGLCLLRVGY